MAPTHATPLIALDALAIDTETTSLDAAKARIIEIAGVPIRDGAPAETGGFTTRINPGEGIPAAATQIHGIDDRAVAQAPSFAQSWPQLSRHLAADVLIGHMIGFDLAVLKRECARSGLDWRPPRTLDTRLLAQAVEPNLGGYSLEHLAAWLGVEVSGRHSAAGDAATAARIFLALIPKLRAANIRTLAEAEQVCRGFSAQLESDLRAGWEEPVAAPAQRHGGPLGRIDIYPYRHRVADVMSAPAKFIAPDAPLSAALKQMSEAKISSLLVATGGAMRAKETGIITERDVLRALSQKGAAALDRPVSEFASKPLVALPAAAFVYRALGRMARLKLRHLGVEDEKGSILGVVTARDLLRLRAQEATILGDGLDQADTVPQLAAAWAGLPHAAAGLVVEGVSGREVAAVISRELGALTRRAGMLAERRMDEDGHGAPPCGYALCVLGSAGRGESLLAMDQDNAVVFAQGEPGGETDRWFARFGGIVADILHEVGVPYCKGGVMAKNEQWRGSVDTWHARIAEWIARSSPADLLSVDIFFDLAGVSGDLALADGNWRGAFDAARGNAAFAKLLAESAGELESGLTLFGGLRSENGRIDLKRCGLFGIVTTARVLAIHHHIVARPTPVRLSGIAALGHAVSDLDALKQAHGVFVDFILAQQLADIERGLPPSNKVEVKRLGREQRARLKDALRATAPLATLTRDLLF